MLAGMIDQIGSFKVLRELGRGGMGVVYLARDTRLDRQVAIKMLPSELATDPSRLERFEREARLLASLNHPNLAGIYGVEEQDGARYLVLEFVEGESLAERLDRGPLPPDEAVEYAAQIASGVEAAHDAGVIHRDLKPANVMITPDGRAKVLDFGLARIDEGSQSSSGADATPTMTTMHPQRSPTVVGAILGTAAYMSPEQARGRRVDKRTDIWSFGVLLYEMLVGSSPFYGETATDSIGAVLHKDLDLTKLPENLPLNVRRVLERCLVRDRDMRYRDIGDVRVELLRADWEQVGTPGATAQAGTLRMSTVLVLLIVVGALASAASWLGSRALIPEPERIVRKLEVYSADIDDDFNWRSVEVSPDGMKIAFVQDDAIMIRDLSTLGLRTLVEASGIDFLAWSPDGRSLAYSTRTGLFRISMSGGAPSRLSSDTVPFEMVWDENDRILFATEIGQGEPGIVAVSGRGGTPERVLDADPADVVDFHGVSTIPDTDILLYIRHRTDQRMPIEAWDGERSVVIADLDDLYNSTPVWSPTGHVLFMRGFGQTDLWAVPFSPEELKTTGEPFLVLTDATWPSVAADGTLVAVRGSIGSSGELVWVMPDGSVETIGDGGALVQGPLVAPDGSRVAFAAGTSLTEFDIWTRDLERGINTRISSLDGFVTPIAWSPDGREIAVLNVDPMRQTEAQQTVFLAADGSGQTRDPYPGLLVDIDSTWSRAVLVSDPRMGPITISAVDLADWSVIGEIVATEDRFVNASISPDGEHIAYVSNGSDGPQVYVTSFPAGDGRWQISSDGGAMPYWSADGSVMYYLNNDRDLMRVDVTREPDLRFGIPEPAFDSPPVLSEIPSIRPAPDGERFIAVGDRAEDTEETGYKVLLIENWYEEFRENSRR
jgi:serine/threonine protein kinase